MIGVTGNSNKCSKNKNYLNSKSSVRAVISQSGHIADFTREKDQDFAIVKRFINPDHPNRETALTEISLVTYLNKNVSPFFLSHGTQDERLPVDMTRKFTLVLEVIKHEYKYIEVEGGKHSLTKSRPKEASEVFGATMKFIQKYAFQKVFQTK